MRRHIQSYLLVSIGFFLLLFATTFNRVAADEPGQKLEQLREEIDKLQGDLGGLRFRRDKEQKKLRTTEKKIGQLVRSLRDLKLEQQKQKTRLRELEKQQRQQKAEFRQQHHALMAQLRTAYMTGRQEYLKMFLNQQEPQKIGRILAYYNYFNRARIDNIDQVRGKLIELDRLTSDIEQERQKIARLTEQQNLQKQVLEKSRQARSRALAVLKRDISKGSSRLAQLRQNEQRLTGLLSRLEEAGAQEPSKSSSLFGRAGTRLPWPVEGQIKARFGSPRTAELRWKGVLIDAAEGLPVQAISPGKIVFADWLRGYGLLIIIDHGSGYMSLYGHNQSLQKETGSWVEAGETISTVGNSGGNEHAGLYFEIRHNGRPVDPAKWCVARKK